MNRDDWRPSCSLPMLQTRAVMLRAIRHFFEQRGYLEVETPSLARDIVIDAWLEPLEVTSEAERWFLQTSPEAFMKRLLAAGSGSIYQISRVFRQGESGERHNPEFTMVEWYGVDSTWQEQMDLTEALVRTAVTAATQIVRCDVASAWPTAPFSRTTYAAVFSKIFGIDVHSSQVDDLLQVARRFEIHLPETGPAATVDDILNVLLAARIEPTLGRTPDGRPSPEFLCDYPPSQAALAVTSETEPRVARRFELYIEGLELCNGYQELTNRQELEHREQSQNAIRRENNLPPLPGARRMLKAMDSGLPECSGVALGFDRLVMIATQSQRIANVLPFPADRA